MTLVLGALHTQQFIVRASGAMFALALSCVSSLSKLLALMKWAFQDSSQSDLLIPGQLAQIIPRLGD